MDFKKEYVNTKMKNPELEQIADGIIDRWLEDEMFGYDEGDVGYARLKRLIKEPLIKFQKEKDLYKEALSYAIDSLQLSSDNYNGASSAYTSQEHEKIAKETLKYIREILNRSTDERF